jgi:hypothetical protein
MATMQKEKDEARHQVSNFGRAVGEKVSDATEAAGNKAKEIGSNVKEMGSNVIEKAGEAASFVGTKAEDVTSSVGAGMKNLAGTIREHTPAIMSEAGTAVSDTLESGGRYLTDKGLKGIGEDVSELIRRNPVPALFVAIGLGFLLAKATSHRS